MRTRSGASMHEAESRAQAQASALGRRDMALLQPITLNGESIGTIVIDDGLSDIGAKMLEDAGVTIMIATVGGQN